MGAAGYLRRFLALWQRTLMRSTDLEASADFVVMMCVSSFLLLYTRDAGISGDGGVKKLHASNTKAF